MNETIMLLTLTLWVLTMFIAFMIGGAMGTRCSNEMFCSKCGHKGK